MSWFCIVAAVVVCLLVVVLAGIFYWVFVASLQHAGAMPYRPQSLLQQCPGCHGLALTSLPPRDIVCPHCGILYDYVDVIPS